MRCALRLVLRGDKSGRVMTGEARVHISTEQEPYHYVGSGLTNVHLVGVEYAYADGQVQAEIPALPNLLEAVGDAVAGKDSSLRGEEIRFLRKRLRISAKDFARALDLTPEHYSRIENAQVRVTQGVELNVRLLYAGIRKLASLSERIAEKRIHLVELRRPTWSAEFANERIIACRDASGAWTAHSKLAA